MAVLLPFGPFAEIAAVNSMVADILPAIVNS